MAEDTAAMHAIQAFAANVAEERSIPDGAPLGIPFFLSFDYDRHNWPACCRLADPSTDT